MTTPQDYFKSMVRELVFDGYVQALRRACTSLKKTGMTAEEVNLMRIQLGSIMSREMASVQSVLSGLLQSGLYMSVLSFASIAQGHRVVADRDALLSVAIGLFSSKILNHVFEILRVKNP